MSGMKILAAICIAALVVAIVPALVADPMLVTFFAMFDQMNAWPFAVALDLMIGFVFFSFVIYLIEGDVTKALYWVVPLFLFGNLVSAVYLIVNMDKVRDRLSPAT
jgi:hypothetical protein